MSEARDPFADDVLERLIASNQHYQRTHGNYIVPLAERLLACRAREQTERERANEFEAALKDIATYREIDVNGEYTTTEPIEGYDAYCIARKVLSAREPGEEVCEDCGHDLSLHTAGGMCSAEIKGGCHCIRMRA